MDNWTEEKESERNSGSERERERQNFFEDFETVDIY